MIFSPKKIVVVLALAFILIVFTLYLVGRNGVIVEYYKFTLEPIPNFEAALLSNSKVLFKSKEKLGSKWILVIWSSWLHDTESNKINWDTLLKASKKYKKYLYGLNYKDTREKAISYLATNGDPFTLSVFDETGQIGNSLEVIGLPTLLLIKEDGEVSKLFTSIEPEDWENDILPELLDNNDQ